jgi:hypothetical protein
MLEDDIRPLFSQGISFVSLRSVTLGSLVTLYPLQLFRSVTNLRMLVPCTIGLGDTGFVDDPAGL